MKELGLQSINDDPDTNIKVGVWYVTSFLPSTPPVNKYLNKLVPKNSKYLHIPWMKSLSDRGDQSE